MNVEPAQRDEKKHGRRRVGRSDIQDIFNELGVGFQNAHELLKLGGIEYVCAFGHQLAIYPENGKVPLSDMLHIAVHAAN